MYLKGNHRYEEALVVSELNAGTMANPSKSKIVLGGTTIHNSASFLAELRQVGL